MRSKILLTIVILLVFLACHFAKVWLAGVDPTGGTTTTAPRRIVSMAPSVTETLFALGLGSHVVGVSDYCSYPPEVKKIDRIGGVMDPNVEAIVALRPDLVVMLHGNKDLCPVLQKFGIETLLVDHKTIKGVLESIPAIGWACGNAEAAGRMADDLRERIDRVRKKTAGLRRPRVMVSVIRLVGTGRLEDVYVAGNDQYFDEMIEIAGGRNVFGEQMARYPVVSNESIIKVNPEIIIDIVSSTSDAESSSDTSAEERRTKTLADWQQLPDVEAVRSGKVYCLDENYISVPGPRFVLVLEKLEKVIHPEGK